MQLELVLDPDVLPDVCLQLPHNFFVHLRRTLNTREVRSHVAGVGRPQLLLLRHGPPPVFVDSVVTLRPVQLVSVFSLLNSMAAIIKVLLDHFVLGFFPVRVFWSLEDALDLVLVLIAGRIEAGYLVGVAFVLGAVAAVDVHDLAEPAYLGILGLAKVVLFV